MSKTFDCIVVGKGLIGSAAVRYISQQDTSVAIIGPDEPNNLYTHRGVFAAHYDSSRATRLMDVDPIWSKLAQRSQAAYSEIEDQSGIIFNNPVGRLRISGLESDSIITTEINWGKASKYPFELVDNQSLIERYPYLSFPSSAAGVLEIGYSGFLDPRKLIEAQLILAHRSGASIIREIIDSLKFDDGVFRCSCKGGEEYYAPKVLLSAGAYCNTLLDKTVSFRLLRETLLLAENQ